MKILTNRYAFQQLTIQNNSRFMLRTLLSNSSFINCRLRFALVLASSSSTISTARASSALFPTVLLAVGAGEDNTSTRLSLDVALLSRPKSQYSKNMYIMSLKKSVYFIILVSGIILLPIL